MQQNMQQNMRYKFAAADRNESIVFGAAKPKSDADVAQWIDFMQAHAIQRVCCLLAQSQLSGYSDLLGAYRWAFGPDRICWTPIEDFQLVDRTLLLQEILPFLHIANQQGEKAVVHCSGGIGRTGQVLAAWLVSGRSFSNGEAIAAVKRTGRNPHEAVIAAVLRGRNPWNAIAALNALLDACRTSAQ